MKHETATEIFSSIGDVLYGAILVGVFFFVSHALFNDTDYMVYGLTSGLVAYNLRRERKQSP